MFDGRWRSAVDRTTGPVGEALHRRGITADVLTATGLVSATITALLVATGPSPPGHRLAHHHRACTTSSTVPWPRRPGTASVRGAFFDSVTDRVADAVLMCGVRLVPRRPQGGTSRPPAHGHIGGDRPGLLRAGQGGVTRSGRQGRSDGAGRAHVPARRRLPERGHLRAGPVGALRTGHASLRSPGSSRSGTRRPGRDEIIRRRIEAWREGRVDSRWRAWREGRERWRPAPRADPRPAPARGRAGGPLAGAAPRGLEQPFGTDTARTAPRRPSPRPHGPAVAQPPVARSRLSS